MNSNTSKQTLFEEKLEKFKIKYNRIRRATPRHNGKVEYSIGQIKNVSTRMYECTACRTAENN